jgi:micrococcal nuclease
MKKPFLALFLAFSISSACAHQVIGISDGDTMTLLVDQKPLKIRLANIDAPEKQQAFGQRSKQSLSDLCWGKDATYQAQTIDKYGRTVAVVTCGRTKHLCRRGSSGTLVPRRRKRAAIRLVSLDRVVDAIRL